MEGGEWRGECQSCHDKEDLRKFENEIDISAKKGCKLVKVQLSELNFS